MKEQLKKFYRDSGLKGMLLRVFPFYHKKILGKDLMNLGTNLKLEPNIIVRYPEFCCIGSNVKIEAGVQLLNLGGLVIGDNVVLEKNVQIGNENCSFPILIGKNTRIKGGTVTLPETTAGNNIYFIDKEDDGGFNVTLPINKNTPLKTGEQLGKNLFFIVSTGRSGSTSIARILTMHPQADCKHEVNTLLIQLASDYKHGKVDKATATKMLHIMYTECSVFPNLVYGESDQKLSFLIEILAELLPECKFIWLIRNASDFARSATNRSWYGKEARGEYRELPIVQKWVTNRLDGYLCGEMSAIEWAALSPYEKNCWYWSYCNQTIEDQLSTLSPLRQMQIKLEELSDRLPVVLEFLDLSPAQLPQKIYNKGGSGLGDVLDCEIELNKWCGKGMSKWYDA